MPQYLTQLDPCLFPHTRLSRAALCKRNSTQIINGMNGITFSDLAQNRGQENVSNIIICPK